MALTLSEQLRASHVKRWHIVNTSRVQTLAEHSFNVSVIAGSLAARLRWPGLLVYESKLNLLNWALTHDLIEVKTGDIPTPTKKVLSEVSGTNILEQMESKVDYEAMMLYRQIRNTDIEYIVKVADLLEALNFLADHAVGAHAISVYDLLEKELEELVDDLSQGMPEATNTFRDLQRVVREIREEIHL